MQTNELTREINSLLRPRAALLAYSTDGGGSHYLELRKIGPDGRMCEGVPVTTEFIDKLIEGYSEHRSTTPYGKLPENMLWSNTRKGCEKYVWYNPPRKRVMYFHTSLGIEDGEYNLPGVIYRVSGNSLHIYAYKDETLTPETPLYAAPFFNVTGSRVCLGNAAIAKPSDLTYEHLIEYWEKKFWLTEFLHLGGAGNPTRSNLVLVTKAAGKAPFDTDELIPLGEMKLKDILK